MKEMSLSDYILYNICGLKIYNIIPFFKKKDEELSVKYGNCAGFCRLENVHMVLRGITGGVAGILVTLVRLIFVSLIDPLSTTTFGKIATVTGASILTFIVLIVSCPITITILSLITYSKIKKNVEKEKTSDDENSKDY